jgi:hypothetical protein
MSGVGVQNKHSTYVECPPPVYERGGIEKKHSTDVESTNRVCASVSAFILHGKSCSDLGQALVLSDPPALQESGVIENTYSIMDRVQASV